MLKYCTLLLLFFILVPNLPDSDAKLLGHRDQCTRGEPCGSGLVCIEWRCSCPYPLHQFYNQSSWSCTSLLKGPCLEEVDGISHSIPCASNAECGNVTDARSVSLLNVCVCSDGNVESHGRACKADYGQPCSISSECSSLKGYVCREGKCTCPDFHSDSDCTKVVGSVCNYTDQYKSDCPLDLRCVRLPGEATNGICQCQYGKSQNSERECVRL